MSLQAHIGLANGIVPRLFIMHQHFIGLKEFRSHRSNLRTFVAMREDHQS